ncbi:MAG: type VI secretion system tube protein TssD [Methylovirgula sp.]
MAQLGFIKITGTKQGLITSGANSSDSIGNNFVDGSDYADQSLVTIFSSQVSVPTNPQTGQPTGSPVQVPSTFTKYVDKASPLLWQSLTTGEMITDMVLSLWRTTSAGAQQKYFTYEWKNVIFVGGNAFKPDVLNTTNSSYTDMETWSFTFGSVTWTNVVTGTSGAWSATKPAGS